MSQLAIGVVERGPACRFIVEEISQAGASRVEHWLSDPSISRWMDFGGGRQILSSVAIRVLARSRSHFIRMICDDEGSPFAIVGLQHVDSQFRNAMLWYLRSNEGRNNGIRASEFVSTIVDYGFRSLGLLSVHAWVAEGNIPSIALLRRLRFNESGRMRLSHRIDDVPCDRILFDITRDEFRQLGDLTENCRNVQ